MDTPHTYREPVPMPHRESTRDKGIAELLKDLRDETTTLLRQEVALAKTEMSEKASVLGRNVVYLAIGGAIAYAALLFILLAVTYLLMVGLLSVDVAPSVASWLAPLLVGIVVGVIGYGLIQKAISTFRHESLVPRKTLDSLQENKQWAQLKLQ